MLDYITTTINVIVQKLGQSNYWPNAVKPLNTITFVKAGRWPDKLKEKGASDFPEFKIETQTIDTKRLCKTFQNTTSDQGDVIIEQKAIFHLTITHDGQSALVADQLFAEFSAIMVADPKLGQSYIKESGESRSRMRNMMVGGTKRLLQEIDFPVTFWLHRKDIYPATK